MTKAAFNVVSATQIDVISAFEITETGSSKRLANVHVFTLLKSEFRSGTFRIMTKEGSHEPEKEKETVR